jgi:hypothetical protein
MDIITLVTLTAAVLSTLILVLILYMLRRLLVAFKLLHHDYISRQKSTDKILMSATSDILQALKEQERETQKSSEGKRSLP